MSTETVEVFTGQRDARTATLERVAGVADRGAIATADLEGQFRIAVAISNATDAVPRGYRKQPGAVLLALAWATQHDVDVLTAIQGVAFVEGRAVVDATLQRALADRAGYSLAITTSDDAAVVVVSRGGAKLGSAVYTMADAELAGLTGKTNWKKNPEDMLVARATTRAVRRFAPGVLLGLLVSDEDDEAPPPLADLVGPSSPEDPATGDDVADPAVEAPPADADAVGLVEGDAPEGGSPTHDESVSSTPLGPSTGATVPVWTDGAALRAYLKARGIRTPDAWRFIHDESQRLDVTYPAGAIDSVLKADPRLVAAFAAWASNHDVLPES